MILRSGLAQGKVDGPGIIDSDALAAALAEADLVLNTAGPFYLYGRPVLVAAVAAGKHCADIADDWEQPDGEMSLRAVLRSD